jgi:hypothetical protein
MKQRKTITIIIETDGAAFDDHEAGEVSRILRTLCRDLCADNLTPGQNGLYDINGNTTGQCNVELQR